MKDEVAFLCIGQAGGNIGTMFEEKGYNVMYVNTSKEDLDILSKSPHKFHLRNGEGCAKDRDRAKQLLAEDLDRLIAQIKTTITQKYVFVVFSSGGGTGSGISPFLTEILIEEFGPEEEVAEDSSYVPEPQKYFSAVTIIPSGADKAQAASNSYSCCQELLDNADLGSLFILDNSRLENKLTINRIFADTLDRVLNIPSKHKDKRGNVDKAELRRAIFETHGVALAVVLDRKATTAQLIEKVHNNVFAPIEEDRTVLYYVSSTIEPLQTDTLAQEFGEPLDVFSTYNDSCNILLLTGLTFPYTRFNGIKDAVLADSQKIENSIDGLYENRLDASLTISRKVKPKKKRTRTTIVSSTSDGDTSGIGDLKPAAISVEIPKKSARELLGKYKRS